MAFLDNIIGLFKQKEKAKKKTNFIYQKCGGKKAQKQTYHLKVKEKFREREREI